MTPEERLSNFTKTLIESNPIWFDSLPLVFPGKDIKEAIKKSWITLHAEGKLKANIDWKECRMLVNKTLTWAEPKNSDGYEKAEPVDIHPQALTGEARAARIKEFQEAVNKVAQPERIKGSKVFSVVQQLPKDKNYVPQSNEAVYKSDRHLAWLKHRFHPVTMDILPDTMDEDLFNKTYDTNYLKR